MPQSRNPQAAALGDPASVVAHLRGKGVGAYPDRLVHGLRTGRVAGWESAAELPFTSGVPDIHLLWTLAPRACGAAGLPVA